MKYDIKITFPAECFCTVEANSEEELKAALLEGRYKIYEETCGDPEHYFIMATDDEDASDDSYFPEVIIN